MFAAENSPGRSARVLLVDDDRMSLFFTEQNLVDLGYRVTSCQSGAEALDLMGHEPSGFAAVLLDREMPQPDGMAVVRKMGRDPALAGIKFKNIIDDRVLSHGVKKFHVRK